MAAHLTHDAPEPRRVVHLDEMRHLMGGEVIEHEGRREDQPPGERQRARRGARTPAARLVADRHPPHPDAEFPGVYLRGLLQILACLALEEIMDAPLGVFGIAGNAENL